MPNFHQPRTRQAATGVMIDGGDYSPEETAFLSALIRWKAAHQRPRPTTRELMRLVHELGWRRVEQPAPEYAHLNHRPG